MALTQRPPIVAVMGHIDHGKSSLLDYIRNTNVVAKEAGGITQKVSAYVAEHEHEGVKRSITFLDTPGHEAFRSLRARGAAVADIAILVIAAEEGVKPQTIEAYNAIIESNIPFVVAFTKIDKNGADIEKAKVSALEAGIYLEGLGGTIPYIGISSKTGEGVPELLGLVLLTADLQELTGDPSLPASGFVLESSQDPKKGTSATLIIKNGSMKAGEVVVAGTALAPVRFIEDWSGARIALAIPSLPIVLSGFDAIPSSGTPFVTFANKKEAEKYVKENIENKTAAIPVVFDETKTIIPVCLKSDVTGSIEALEHELAKIEHERVALRIVSKGVGAVNENDVKLAQTGNGIVIAFNVGTDSSARDLGERLNVPIFSFSIIYDIEKSVRELMQERSPKMVNEEKLAEVKIIKVFSTAGAKQVIGANLLSGNLSVGMRIKLVRRDIELDSGKFLNLQQARADVKEIRTEGEFGAQIECKTDVAPGDTLIAFRVVES